MYVLFIAAAGSEPSLSSILQHCSLWSKLFKTRGTSTSDWQPANAPLNALLLHVYNTLTATAHDIKKGKVGLRTFHTCVSMHADFLAILSLLKCGHVSKSVLQERALVLTTFDQQLAEVKCYVNFFCSCGTRIDASHLQALVTDLSGMCRKMDVYI